MAIEQFVNDPGTYLTTGCTSGDATVTVVNASGYPTSGNFRIKIDDEIMIVTAVSGAVWTVTRGAESTTAAAHLGGAGVNHVFTAGGLDGRLASTQLIGTASSLPSAGSTLAGTSYQCTDSPVQFVHNGSAWKAYGPCYNFTLPVLSDMTAMSNTATTTDTGAGITITGSANQVSLFRRASNLTAPFNITMYVMGQVPIENYAGITIMGIDKTGGGNDGKFVVYGLQYAGGLTVVGQNLNANLSWSSNTFQTGITAYGISPHAGVWMRIRDDNTNRLFQLSGDGILWQTVYSVGRTNWCTVNQGGWSISGSASTYGPSARILHYSQG